MLENFLNLLGDERFQGSIALIGLIIVIYPLIIKNQSKIKEFPKAVSSFLGSIFLWLSKHVHNMLVSSEWSIAIAFVIFIIINANLPTVDNKVTVGNYTNIVVAVSLLGAVCWLLIRSLYLARQDIQNLKTSLYSHQEWIKKAVEWMSKQEAQKDDKDSQDKDDTNGTKKSKLKNTFSNKN